MGQVIEFHGRLCRTDHREVAAGRIDLRFRLHLTPEGSPHVWEEVHRAVRLGVGGGYSVLLGTVEPVAAGTFAEPRWVGVYVERDGVLVEVGERSAMTGEVFRLGRQVQALEARVELLPSAPPPPRPVLHGDGIDGEARGRLIKLHRRLRLIESGGGVLAAVDRRLTDSQTRLSRLDDAESGRVVRLEDELHDIVGQDGDLIDILERIEALEAGHGGPMGPVEDQAALLARVGLGEVRAVALQLRVDALAAEVERLTSQLARSAGPPVVSVLPAPVTALKGVHVASGGLVVKEIEGRMAGASRRPGPLLVNAEGGGDLLVGNRDGGSVTATASLRAGRTAAVVPALAVRLPGDGLVPGDVAAYGVRKRGPFVRRAGVGDVPLGVVVAQSAVELGSGDVVVAVAGLVRVRVAAPVRAGVVLEAGEGGVARPGKGPSVGRTLAPSADGMVDLLLHAR